MLTSAIHRDFLRIKMNQAFGDIGFVLFPQAWPNVVWKINCVTSNFLSPKLLYSPICYPRCKCCENFLKCGKVSIVMRITFETIATATISYLALKYCYFFVLHVNMKNSNSFHDIFRDFETFCLGKSSHERAFLEGVGFDFIRLFSTLYW